MLFRSVDRAVNPMVVVRWRWANETLWRVESFTSKASAQRWIKSQREYAKRHPDEMAKVIDGREPNTSVRKNPSAPGLDEAARKLEEFTGRPAGETIESEPRSKDKTGLVIGELDLIGYRQAREGIDGGRMTRFAHKFRKNSRPLLAVSTDGKQLHIVGGQYEFTDAGIEDR